MSGSSRKESDLEYNEAKDLPFGCGIESKADRLLAKCVTLAVRPGGGLGWFVVVDGFPAVLADTAAEAACWLVLWNWLMMLPFCVALGLLEGKSCLARSFLVGGGALAS